MKNVRRESFKRKSGETCIAEKAIKMNTKILIELKVDKNVKRNSENVKDSKYHLTKLTETLIRPQNRAATRFE